MKYISTVQAAEKWGITISRIAKLCKAGQIQGAVQIGSRWMLPENAEKPADRRTRAGKSVTEAESSFRFPIYINFTEESYEPPLTGEERLLRRAQQEFYACRFEEAQRLLLPLCSKSVNIYVRQAAFFLRCYLAVYSHAKENHDDLIHEWNAILSEEFPYKKEMLLLRHAFELDYGYYKRIFEGFCVESDYSYHPSAHWMLALVALIPIEGGRLSILSEIRYDTQELLCQMMERDGYFLEVQQLHFLLLIVYQLKNDKERMSFHIRRGLQIAAERELYFYPAYYLGFYREAMQEVLRELPKDFNENIRSLSRIIQESYAEFTVERRKPSFLGMLSDREYEYAFLASQGLSNREVAQRLKVSERTVSKMYVRIYDKLNVKNKRELIDLINLTLGGIAKQH